MKKYKKQRSPAKMLAAVVSPLLIVAGLAFIGYSFMMGDFRDLGPLRAGRGPEQLEQVKEHPRGCRRDRGDDRPRLPRPASKR